MKFIFKFKLRLLKIKIIKHVLFKNSRLKKKGYLYKYIFFFFKKKGIYINIFFFFYIFKS